MTDDERKRRLSEAGRKGGLKGGKATGQVKNRTIGMTPEQRSERMRAVRRGKKGNGEL